MSFLPPSFLPLSLPSLFSLLSLFSLFFQLPILKGPLSSTSPPLELIGEFVIINSDTPQVNSEIHELIRICLELIRIFLSGIHELNSEIHDFRIIFGIFLIYFRFLSPSHPPPFSPLSLGPPSVCARINAEIHELIRIFLGLIRKFVN